MSDLHNLVRPSFIEGGEDFKYNDTSKQLIPPTELFNLENKPLEVPVRTNNTDVQAETRPSFVSSTVKPRMIDSFEMLEEYERQQQGIKIQLGPQTLDKIIGISVPDVNNPNVMIRKNMSLAEIYNLHNHK